MWIREGWPNRLDPFRDFVTRNERGRAGNYLELVLPQSCVGLREAIDAQLGAELKPAEDASGGNEEMTRATWDNLLGFMNFEEEDFERAKEATARCGPGREVPKAGI